MIQKRNPSASFLVECSLVFLAILVFSWGLQAKLALYHADNGAICATNSMAKLAVENRSAVTTVQIRNLGLPPAVPQTVHWTGFSFSRQSLQASSAKLAALELKPTGPRQYLLQGPNLKRRPPPAIS